MRPMDTQINLCIHAVWSESLLSAWWNVASLAIQTAHGVDPDQIAQNCRAQLFKANDIIS